MIDKGIHREGQLFFFKKTKSVVKPDGVFLIVGRMFHEESFQEVWKVVDLETGEQFCFSEDFLRIKESSSRIT